MSCRCLIGVRYDDTVKFVSCDTYGDLEGVGRELCERWPGDHCARRFVNKGDMSILGCAYEGNEAHLNVPARQCTLQEYIDLVDDSVSFKYLSSRDNWHLVTQDEIYLLRASDRMILNPCDLD